MNFRKILSAALAVELIAAIPSEALAKSYLNTERSGNQITVAADNAGGKSIIGIIVKDGADYTDNSNIFGICETEGTELKFVMPDFNAAVDGEYTLYIGGVNKGNFYYAKTGSITTAKGNLSGISDTDLATALTAGSADYYALGAMGFDLEGYASLGQNAQTVRTNFLAAATASMTEEETAAEFNKAVAAVAMNNGTSAADALAKANPSFGGVKYNDADAALKTWIDEYMQANVPADNADFDAKYELANVLYLLNTAKFSDINGILTTYASSLGLAGNSSYATYLTLTDKTKVHDYMVEYFKTVPCKSTNVLTTALAGGVTAAIGSQGGQGGYVGGGGGGSSSGGNGGGNNSFLVPPVTQETTRFHDLESVAWAEDAINALADKNIVSGSGNGEFNPQDYVTREQFVKMIVSATGTPTADANGEFEDVKGDEWYAPYVIGAYKAGLVYGVSENYFGIGSKISRQDMAVIAYRALGGKQLEKTRDFAEFADYDSIADYAKDAIAELYEAGIVSGKDGNMFDPLGTATRAESAVVIYNLFVR